MSDVYEEAYHHFVWATKMREEMVLPRFESLLHGYVRQKCREMGAFVYAINGMPDHLHLACAIPGTLAVSDFMNGVKGGSSYYISHLSQGKSLRWQPGYGHLTFATNDLARVTAYVGNQKIHYSGGSLSPKMERTSSGPEGLSPINPALQGRVTERRTIYRVSPRFIATRP